MAHGAENRRGDLLLLVKRAWLQIPPFAHFLLINHLEIIHRSIERNVVNSVLFSTVLHEEPVQEENIVKARNFRFSRFFRAPDLKTEILLIKCRSNNRRTIVR